MAAGHPVRRVLPLNGKAGLEQLAWIVAVPLGLRARPRPPSNLNVISPPPPATSPTRSGTTPPGLAADMGAQPGSPPSSPCWSGGACAGSARAAAGADGAGRVDSSALQARDLLRRFPLIDGHNDLPWELRERGQVNLAEPVTRTHTDLAAGGGWRRRSVLVGVRPGIGLTGDRAVIGTLEQIDFVHHIIERYPDAPVSRAHRRRRGAAFRPTERSPRSSAPRAATRSARPSACCVSCTGSVCGT